MKTLLSLAALLLTVSCSNISSPRVEFGMKCVMTGDKIAYSYVWVYDKNIGLPATAETCSALKKN
jgi:hypothetical protein